METGKQGVPSTRVPRYQIMSTTTVAAPNPATKGVIQMAPTNGLIQNTNNMSSAKRKKKKKNNNVNSTPQSQFEQLTLEATDPEAARQLQIKPQQNLPRISEATQKDKRTTTKTSRAFTNFFSLDFLRGERFSKYTTQSTTMNELHAAWELEQMQEMRDHENRVLVQPEEFNANSQNFGKPGQPEAVFSPAELLCITSFIVVTTLGTTLGSFFLLSQ